jgi:hypothetical protein
MVLKLFAVQMAFYGLGPQQGFHTFVRAGQHIVVLSIA